MSVSILPPPMTAATCRTTVARSLARGAVVALIALATSAAGCQSTCDSLADFICGCEPNQSQQSACTQAVKNNSDREVSEADLAVCEQKLDTCTCAALEDQDLVACGLAKSP